MSRRTNAIRRLDRRLVASNTRLEVYFDDIVDEHDRRVRDFMTVMPKGAASDGVGGVAVLPIVENRIGVLRVRRHTFDVEHFEIVKGFVEAGEDPSQSARREFEEESGLSADTAEWLDLGCAAPDAGLIGAIVRIFAAIGATDAQDRLQSDDLGRPELDWLTWPEALRAAEDGRILDAVSLVAVFRAAREIGPWRGASSP